MGKENTRGNHQPYWYESFVGLLYVIDLFDDNSDVESVEFQSIETQKLDDVVVTYKDNKIECIQVKSTEKKDTIGFETLVNKYLEDWSKEWKELKDTKKEVNVTLFSNRRISDEWEGSEIAGRYTRPRLDEFWKHIEDQIEKITKIGEIKMPCEKKWDTAWGEWLEKIKHLNDGKLDLRLDFMRSFQLKLEQEDYLELEDKILEIISTKYNIDSLLAQKFLNDLKAALSNWTTIDGKKKYGNTVTKELVLRTVNQEERYSANNHNIPYNENFFMSRERYVKDIIDEIKTTDKRVMFLKGAPGTGKTTIISYMAYMNSIDFRFYSYKPFNLDSNDPGHELNKSRDLWSDLYYQIKEYIVTNIRDIKEFKLIPYVEWIKQESLKYEVLRLLKQLALKKEQRVVIAIDGIDHAARGEDIDNFLKSFISPDIIPNNVFFLVTGQPEYKEYPNWLLDERFAIQKSMMNITIEDIRQLYLSSDINKKIFDENIFIDIIKHKVYGNTLSAIYAVKEAEQCSDMEKFNRRLSERNLEYNVENYYSTIWGYCLSNINERIRDTIDIQLSTIFSVSPKGITISLLKDIFDKHNLNEDQWSETLERLRPLVSKFKESYYIDINDVKVYLNRRVNQLYDQEKVNEVIQKLANYYLSSKKQLYEKHYTAFKILKRIENEKIFMTFFDIEFALEAITINQSRFDLREQVNYVIEKAYNLRQWDILFNVFHVLRVLEQSKKTVEWYGNKYIDDKCGNEYLYTEICRYPNLLDYSFINKIFKDAENLFWNNKLNRAHRLLNKYFENKTFEEITAIFTNKGINEKDFSMRFRERIFDIGRICRYCEFIIKIDKQLTELSQNEKRFMEFFTNGWLEASKDFENISQEITFKMPMLMKEELLNYLYKLDEFDHWKTIFGFIKKLVEKELSISYTPILLQLGAWLIQKGEIDLFDEVFKSQLMYTDIINGIKKISIIESNNKKIKLLAFCNFAYIFGFNNWELLIDDKLIKCYYEHLKYEEICLLTCLLNLNYHYGNLFSRINSLKENQDTIEFKEDLQSLLSRDGIYTIWINTDPFVKDAIFKLIDFSQQCGRNFEKEVFEQFVRKIDSLSENIQWSLLFSKDLCIFLIDRGENSKVIEYIRSVSNTSSYIWKINKSNRDCIVSELLYCGKKINIENEYIEYLKEWSKWFSISYIDDREYILYDLYDFLELLLRNTPEKWKDYFSSVLNLSKTISMIGSDDTKLMIDVEIATAAMNCSKNDLWNFINNMDDEGSYLLYVLNRVIVDFLDNQCITGVSQKSLSIDDLIFIWDYIYKNSDDDSNSQSELYRLKESIVNYLVRFNLWDSQIKRFTNINSVNDRLAQLSKVNNVEKIEKTYEEIISYINDQRERKYPDWRGCIDLIDYVEKYRPKTMKEDINQIISFTKIKFNTYSIVNTDIEDIYNRVFRFIDDEMKWDIIYFHVIDTLKNIESYDSWLSYIAGNLSKLLIMKSNEFKIEDLEKQIKLIIEMHERILTGNFRCNYLMENKIEFKNCACNNWKEFLECVYRKNIS